MNYSNINYTENFIKFKKPKIKKPKLKQISKVGQGAIKTGGKIGKGGLTAFKTINPLSIISDSATGVFGGGSSNFKIMSYIVSCLVCLMLVAYIIFQLKR